ncbi:MAG: hypothetical protein MJ153_04180 [Clostridia bacterium]|nr:hypothetical protein [Clostridia bacterium]
MDNRKKRDEHINKSKGKSASADRKKNMGKEAVKPKAPDMFNVNSKSVKTNQKTPAVSSDNSKTKVVPSHKSRSVSASNSSVSRVSDKNVSKKTDRNSVNVKGKKGDKTTGSKSQSHHSDVKNSVNSVKRSDKDSKNIKKNSIGKNVKTNDKKPKEEKDYKDSLVSQSATVGNVTVEDVQKERNSKNKHKRAEKTAVVRGLTLAAIVLATMVVLIFLVYHLYNYIAVKPEQSFITSGSIEHTIGAKAMVIRNEEVMKSTCQGDLVTKSAEGARISTGQQLAMVVPADLQSVVVNLRNTESQISDVQLELIQQGMASGADNIYSKIDELLVPIIDSLRQDSMNSNISNVTSYQSSIEVLISQREELLLQVDFDDDRLDDLRRDERNYENQLAKSATIIYAQNPGIVSFKIDGNEEQLTFDYMLNGDAGEVSKYIDSAVGVIPSDNYVNKDEGVARIAKNDEQYLAVVLENNISNNQGFEVDTFHNINIPSEGVSIDNCKVVRETVTGEGLLIVFSTTKHVEDLVDLRSVDIEIVITEARGMKVPLSSLVNPDYERGIASLYVNKSGFVEAVDVLIVDNDREFAIITPVGDSNIPNLNTVIITNPSSTAAGNKITN